MQSQWVLRTGLGGKAGIMSGNSTERISGPSFNRRCIFILALHGSFSLISDSVEPLLFENSEAVPAGRLGDASIAGRCGQQPPRRSWRHTGCLVHFPRAFVDADEVDGSFCVFLKWKESKQQAREALFNYCAFIVWQNLGVLSKDTFAQLVGFVPDETCTKLWWNAGNGSTLEPSGTTNLDSSRDFSCGAACARKPFAACWSIAMPGFEALIDSLTATWKSLRSQDDGESKCVRESCAQMISHVCLQ